MKLGIKVDLGPGHIVLGGDPALPKRGTTPLQFSAHVRCGQTAGYIEMPLGMEVGLDPGDFVLDGNQLPLKGAQPPPPIFGPYLLWPNGRPSQLLLRCCSAMIWGKTWCELFVIATSVIMRTFS